LVKLRKQLEQVTAYNTELLIDIRVLKDKFRKLPQRQKLAVAHGIFGEETSENTVSSLGNVRANGVEDFEPTECTPASNEDELAAMEQFASVWSMPDDDDIDEDDVAQVDTPAMNPTAEHDREIAGAVNSAGSALDRPEEGEGLSSGALAGIVAGAGAMFGGIAFAFGSRKDEECTEQKEEESADDETGAVFGAAAAPHLREGSEMALDETAPTDEQVFVIANNNSDSAWSEENDDLERGYPSPGHDRNERFYLRSDEESGVEAVGRDISYPPTMLDCAASPMSSFDEEMGDPGDDLRRLGKEIEMDDLKALESEASVLAEQFKLNSTFLESISDIQANDAEGMKPWNPLHDLDVSKITAGTSVSDSVGSPFRPKNKSNEGIFFDRSVFTATTDEMNENSSSTDVPVSVSAGESSGGAVVSRWATLELMEDYSSQHAGEPSGDVNFSHEPRRSYDHDDGHDNDDDDDHYGMKPHLPPQYQTPSNDNISRLPYGGRSTLRSSFSSSSSGLDSPLNRSQNDLSLMIADWSAVGATGGLLADLSDSQSNSSYSESYADSISSMEATARVSHLDVPMAKTIDQLVAQADFEAVKAAAEKFEVASIDTGAVDEARNTKIAENKRKKRELEAWRISLSRSFEQDLN
jgi:hypothetical protein